MLIADAPFATPFDRLFHKPIVAAVVVLHFLGCENRNPKKITVTLKLIS
jgi:hypothetical protein